MAIYVRNGGITCETLYHQFPKKIMKNNDWLTRFLLAYARITKPDGRPLYAYKCSDKKYDELKGLCQQILFLDGKGKLARRIPQIFCLYAAETFCREHDGGVWSWDTVFKPLGIDTPPQPVIANWVEKGLDWWCRKLILGQNGDRRLLTTIACEGGLPLRLLQKDNAAINQFFRAVLENYHAQGCGGMEMAETLSRYQAYRLPTSLRQSVVFHLSGELITAVVELQREIGSVQNPLAALDEKVPDWRHRLPLRLEEQTAENLFNGLVKRSSELVRAAKSRLRWRGKLRQTVTGWRVEKYLELPETVSGEQVCHWLGQDTVPSPRLRLLLNTPSGTEIIAWLTLSGGSGETARYRSEWLKRGGLSLFDNAVMEPHSLSLYDGQKEYPLSVENGEPWGELPWLFVEKSTTGNLEFLGEGSVRTRAEQAWVLAAESLTAHANASGHCEKLGHHLPLKRIIYRVDGTVDFLTAEQDRYRMVCQAANDSSESYSISGATLTEATNPYPIYRGLPRISNNEHYRTQWRPVNNGGHWREGETNCYGTIWLRLQDAANNIEIFRRKVSVLPKAFRLISVIGEGEAPGAYRFLGLMNALVAVDTGLAVAQIAEGVEIICPLLQRANLPELIVNLHWPTGSLAIQLPYPQRGAVFQLAGKMLQRDDCIPLDRLGGLRLLLQDSVSGHCAWLDAELITAETVDAELPRLRFRERLPALVSGRCETTLLVWQERIASLLNSSRSLDAFIQLDVSTTKGECLARLQIARFDSSFKPNYPAYHVGLSDDTLHRLDPDWQQRVRLEMFPLWSPNSPPLSLDVNPEHFACWNVPTGLPSGPWWIIGRDSDWARFRPLLWIVNNRDATDTEAENNSPLVAAIREANGGQREIMLSQMLQELGQNPDHPDWLRLFDLIRLSREFPPSSLNVLTRLVSYPQTLALALLKADDELFDCVWTLAEQLPFSWSLLSVSCWAEAATLYFQSLRTALGDIDTNGDIVFGVFQQFRERTSLRREYWSALCDWLQQRIFKDKPLQSSPLQLARQVPAFFDEQIDEAERELQSRHDAEEHWPKSDEIMQRVDHNFVDLKYQYQRLSTLNRTDRCLRSVRCAPFVAANLSINSIVSSDCLISEFQQTEPINLFQLSIITDNLIYELRLLRAFDSEWFDAVYAISLTLELSRLPLESEK
jgi:hypothetical protein